MFKENSVFGNNNNDSKIENPESEALKEAKNSMEEVFNGNVLERYKKNI